MIEAGDKWLRWAREFQSIAQTSLHYASNRFEKERAQRLLELAAIIASEYSVISPTKVGFFFMDNLPEPFSRYRTTQRQLRDAMDAHKDPGWQAVFDYFRR